MTKRQKEQAKWIGIGAIGIVILSAFLPAEYDPVQFIKDQIQGIV